MSVLRYCSKTFSGIMNPALFSESCVCTTSGRRWQSVLALQDDPCFGTSGSSLEQVLLQRQETQLRNECKYLGLKACGLEHHLRERLMEHYQRYLQSQHSLWGVNIRNATNYPMSLLHPTKHDITTTSLCDPNRPYILRVKGIPKSGFASAAGVVLIDANRLSSSSTVNSDNVSGEHRPNTGKNDAEVFTAGFFLEERLLFHVEYSAILMGLEISQKLGARHVILQIDNNIIVQQLQGIIPVRATRLRHIYWQILSKAELFLDRFEVSWIPWMENSVAGRLATVALGTGQSLLAASGDMNRQSGQCFTLNQDDLDSLTRTARMSKKQRRWLFKHYGLPKTAHYDGDSIDPERTYLLKCDGGFRGEFGQLGCRAGAGMVIYGDEMAKQEVWCGFQLLSQYGRSTSSFFPSGRKRGLKHTYSPTRPSGNSLRFGVSSNNEAEYHSMILVLQQALLMGIRKVIVQNDNKLVVSQVRGIRSLRDAKLARLYQQAKDLVQQFDECEIQHIRRTENVRADFLATHAMEYGCSSFGVLPRTLAYRRFFGQWMVT